MYYKYRNADTRTENILIEKEIWLSKPDQLNDPFECNLTEFLDVEIKKHQDQIKLNQLQGFIFNTKFLKMPFPNVERKHMKSIFKKIQKNKGNVEKQHRIVDSFLKEIGGVGFSNSNGQLEHTKQLFDNLGVFSLSETPLNQLMWAHYANSHSGLALGFKPVPESDLANPDYFQPVEYVEVLPDIDLNQGLMNGLNYIKDNTGAIKSIPFVQINDPQIQKILFTKTADWTYEKEWRYLRNRSGMHPFPGELKEIIFGMKCPQEVRKKFINLCLNNFSHEIIFFEVIADKNIKGQIMLNPLQIDK